MSARQFTEALNRCGRCGQFPVNKVDVIGRFRRFKVACICGEETEWSEDYVDVAVHWNESNGRRSAASLPGIFPAGG